MSATSQNMPRINIYLESINNCERHAKSLFNLGNKLLFRKEPLSLPKCDDNKILADNSNNFFEDKNSKIMEKFTPTENNPVDTNYTVVVHPLTDDDDHHICD